MHINFFSTQSDGDRNEIVPVAPHANTGAGDSRSFSNRVDNTGNVRVWPAEEVLLHLLLLAAQRRGADVTAEAPPAIDNSTGGVDNSTADPNSTTEAAPSDEVKSSSSSSSSAAPAPSLGAASYPAALPAIEELVAHCCRTALIQACKKPAAEHAAAADEEAGDTEQARLG